MFGWVRAARRVFLQPWLRVHIDNNDGLRWCQRHMRRVRVRLLLQWEWRPANRVLLLHWVCINGDDIHLLRHDVFNVHDERLRRGECVRRRIGAARRVFLQPWLRVHIDNNGGLRWCQRHMRRVWIRLLLQRERRPAHRVLLLPWVCVNGDDVQLLRHDVFNLSDERLRSGECVRRRIGAAGALYVHRWVCFHIDNDHGMRRQRRDVSCLRCRSELCGGQRSGGCVQLRRRVCIDIVYVKRMRHNFVHVPCN